MYAPLCCFVALMVQPKRTLLLDARRPLTRQFFFKYKELLHYDEYEWFVLCNVVRLSDGWRHFSMAYQKALFAMNKLFLVVSNNRAMKMNVILQISAENKIENAFYARGIP